jgi:hypothetical protein
MRRKCWQLVRTKTVFLWILWQQILPKGKKVKALLLFMRSFIDKGSQQNTFKISSSFLYILKQILNQATYFS